MGNLFEKSIAKKETILFFKGAPPYFVRNLEYGDHSYRLQMSGWVVSYISNDQDRFTKFLYFFDEYIRSISVEKSPDLLGVFENIAAFCYVENRGLFPKNNILKTKTDDIYKSLFELLERASKSGAVEQVKDRVKNFSDYYYKNNFKILSKCFKKYSNYG